MCGLQSLEGCVSSIEDHGYTIDLGVRGCKAFLQSKMAEKFVSQCRNGTVRIKSFDH